MVMHLYLQPFQIYAGPFHKYNVMHLTGPMGAIPNHRHCHMLATTVLIGETKDATKI